MNYNSKTIKQIKDDCNLCRNSFLVWLASMNFEKDKEENVKEHFYNHCPSCKVFVKIKRAMI